MVEAAFFGADFDTDLALQNRPKLSPAILSAHVSCLCLQAADMTGKHGLGHSGQFAQENGQCESAR